MFSISIVVFLLIMVLPGLKLKSKACGISKQETQSLKGILCLMILLNHFSGWFINPDPILYLFTHCGSFMVSVFFFLSAYGIGKSNTEQKQTFKKLVFRILRVFIPFWISDIIYLCIHYSMDIPLNVEVNAKTMLLSVFNLSEIVHNSWYVSAIVVLYIIHFLIDKIKNINLAKQLLVFYVILVVLSFLLNFVWLTFFVFPIGLLVSNKEKILICLNNCKYAITIVVVTIALLMFISLKFFGETLQNNFVISNLSDILSGMAFAFLVYLLLIKVSIGNKVLWFIGEISYEIYLLHGLGIFVGGKFFGTSYPYAFLLATLVFTFVTAFVVNRICKKIFKLLPIGKK